jgi:hypothetical protein
MSKRHKVPNPEEAHRFLPENAIGHVLYEILLLLEAIRRQQKCAFPDAFYRNATIESFAVHARNLNEFFKGKGDSDDIKPSAFGYPERPKEVFLPADTLTRLNAEISHIGYRRKARGEKWPWSFAQVAHPLKKPCCDFIAHILTIPNLLSEETQRACASIDQKINEIEWPDEMVVIESGGEALWTGSIPAPALRLPRNSPLAANKVATGTSSPDTCQAISPQPPTHP